MFSYLHNNLHVQSFSSSKNSSQTSLCSGNDCNFFGDIFKPIYYDPLHHYFESHVPEFNLEGMQEEAETAISDIIPSPESRKLSRELASTEDADQSASCSEETPSLISGEMEQAQDLFSECKSTAKSSKSLKKRNSKDQEESLHRIQKLIKSSSEQNLNDYDQQALNRSNLVALVTKLIDRESLSQRELGSLDEDSLQLLSNFAFMIYGIELKANSITDATEELNTRMVSTKEKKKRNEERIKYVFKRVNKLLLKRFMSEQDLSEEEENQAMSQVLHKYFGTMISKDSTKKCSYERYFTLLFKPSNMYRNDLKDVFSFKPYLDIFRDILTNEFLQDFKIKRVHKVECYLQDLRNEIFYSSDKSDPSILQKKISRLPWSVAEVQKGMDLFTETFKTF